ncbi:MAG: hypothetical protein ACP5I8_15965, partial [Phycisphaerae bacterium]
INVLNIGSPSSAPLLAGFPASAVQPSVKWSIAATFNYLYISPSGQWNQPKLGDLMATASASVLMPISFGDLASGSVAGSVAVGTVPGSNTLLAGGSVSPGLAFSIQLPHGFQFTVGGSFTFQGGSVTNDSGYQVTAHLSKGF